MLAFARTLQHTCAHRYCFYHETQNILGNTYGMCVLQDFEALTPNLLARTIETVEGVRRANEHTTSL